MWFCFIPLQMTSIPDTNPVDPAFIENLDQIAAKFEGRQETPTSTLVDRLRSTYSYSLIDQLMGKLTIANPQQEENQLPANWSRMRAWGLTLQR